MNISEIIKAISNNINLYNSYISYPNLVTEIDNHPNNEIAITPHIEITKNYCDKVISIDNKNNLSISVDIDIDSNISFNINIDIYTNKIKNIIFVSEGIVRYCIEF